MEAGEDDQAKPPLLVRRAAAAVEQHVAALLRDVPVDPAQVAEQIRQREILVLSDVTLPPAAPPLAAVAFRIDPRAKTAHVTGIGVLESWRRRGLGRRLLTSALTMLRAQGTDRVQAWAQPGSPCASLLASTGFVADNYTADSGGRVRFMLCL